MQQTREIPRDGWRSYLEGLGQHEHAHLVRIETDSVELGAQPMTESAPLRAIALEPKGSAKGSIAVEVGRSGEEITHWVGRATHLYVEEDDDGEPAVLDIESETEGKTLIHFQKGAEKAPQHP